MALTKGIHRDIPDEHYRADPAIAVSDLMKWIDGDKPAGRNLLIGTALHDMILRPDLAKARYGRTPEDWRLNTAEGKDALAAWEADNGKIGIRPTEYAALSAMFKAVEAVAPAFKMFRAALQDNELCVVGTLPGHTATSKARIDAVRENTIFDLKTTHWDESTFIDSMFKYRYFAQAAYYYDLHGIVDGKFRTGFAFVCVMSREPWSVYRIDVDPAILAAGRRWYDDILTLKEKNDGNQQPQPAPATPDA